VMSHLLWTFDNICFVVWTIGSTWFVHLVKNLQAFCQVKVEIWIFYSILSS
jgi:hypothetical protein